METKKILNLHEMTPQKVGISTTIGDVYVRHNSLRDEERLNSLPDTDFGKEVVKCFSGRIKEKYDDTPLSEDDFSRLTQSDIEVLVPQIAKNCGWAEFLSGNDLVSIEKAARIGMSTSAEKMKAALEDLNSSIASSYQFMNDEALKRLQGTMAGLVDIGAGGCAADYIKQNALSSTHGIAAAAAAAEAAGGYDSFAKYALEDKGERKKLKRRSEAAQLEIPAIVNGFKPFNIPPPESTPIGKAAIESAENTRLTMGKMESLVELVAGLHQSIVKDVLPAWFKQVEDGRQSAEKSIDQAARSLAWTKWAVIASVLVAAGTAWWQVSVTLNIDSANTKMQQAAEILLKKQLEAQQETRSLLEMQLVAQQKLLEQQAADMEEMRKMFIPNESKTPQQIDAIPKE